MIKNIETRKINWTIVGARVSSAQFCLNLEKKITIFKLKVKTYILIKEQLKHYRFFKS